VRDWRRAAVIYWLVRVFMQGKARRGLSLTTREQSSLCSQRNTMRWQATLQGGPGRGRPGQFRREMRTGGPYLGGGGGGLGVPVVS
jgi:hypothetical protein